MDRSSSLRTLLRGHPERITDVGFFGSSSDILASVSSKECRIWRIFSREDELCSEILLEMLVEDQHHLIGLDGEKQKQDVRQGGDSVASPSPLFPRVLERIVWHPFNPNQFILLQKFGNSVAIFVETTKLLTTPNSHAQEEPSHAVCHIQHGSNTVDGMLHLIVTDAQGEDCGITDLSWSSQDVRHVLTSHKDGFVRLWDLRSTLGIDHGQNQVDGAMPGSNKKVLSAQCLMTLQVSKHAPVQNCCFLSAFRDASAMFRSGGYTAMEPGSYLTSPFVTYNSLGEVALWSPFTASGSPPKIVRICQLPRDNGQDTMVVPSNVSICTLPFIPPSASITDGSEEKPPSAFVLLSDYRGKIYALHLASQWRNVPISLTVGAEQRIAAVTGFDYVVYFQSLQPIYSQSVVVSLDESSDVKQWNLDMYCVQSKAVQKLTLSPVMCAAPIPLEPGVISAGVTVEKIYQCESSMMVEDKGEDEENDGGDDNIYDDYNVADKIEFHDYEDSDEPSMEEEDEDEDENEEDSEEEDAVDVDGSNDALGMDHLPPPPMPGLFGNNEQGTGAFSNWLGNLAGAVKADKLAPTKSSISNNKSDIDLSSLPLPDEPQIDTRSSSAPPSRATPDLLSPMQIFGMTVKKEEDLEAPKRNRSETAAKETKDKRAFKIQNKKSNKPLVTPVDGKKINILKREDKSAAEEEAQPNTEGNSPVITSNATKEEIEQIVKKALSVHFHKQETIITAEIQKAVRYEVQSGLIPILNKTVAQTLEQTVTKAMKSDVAKTVNEGMKMNSADLASSVSSQIQDPLVKSFHQTMREVMVPAYEKGTRQMFEQIASSIETGLELKRKEKDDTAKLMDGMMKRMDAMGKTIEVLIKAVAQLQTGSIPTPSHEKVARSSSVDRSEVSRRIIIDLLRANEYEKAFTQALSASDSAMALFVCKNSDLSTVLEGERPKLSQPIMLCLMQQLGADLSTDEDLSVKLAWLQSMALILDPQNESVAKHIKSVVQQLVTNLQTKMAQSDPALRRHLQMLLQVIRGIGK